MKNKGDNRANTLIENLLVREDFQRVIETARKELGVPDIADQKKIECWFREQLRSADYGKFLWRYETITEMFDMPQDFQFVIEWIVLGSKLPHITVGLASVEVLEAEAPIIKITVHPFTSKNDVIGAAASSYDSIKLSIKKHRIRSRVYIERDKEIFTLFRLPIKQLRTMANNEQVRYKDLAIHFIMKNKGIEVSPENVRRIIARQRALRAVTYKGG